MVTKKRKSRRKVARKATRRKATRRKTARKAPKRKATRRKAKRKAPKRKAKKATRRKAAKKAPKRKKAARKKRKGSKSSGLNKVSYTVSPALAKIIGSGKHTRPQVVKKLWAYIKKHNCQHATNRRMIVPDANLSEVIGSRPVDMMKLAGHLSKHIHK